MFLRNTLLIVAALALNASTASAQMDLLVEADMPVFIRLMKAQAADFREAAAYNEVAVPRRLARLEEWQAQRERGTVDYEPLDEIKKGIQAIPVPNGAVYQSACSKTLSAHEDFPIALFTLGKGAAWNTIRKTYQPPRWVILSTTNQHLVRSSNFAQDSVYVRISGSVCPEADFGEALTVWLGQGTGLKHLDAELVATKWSSNKLTALLSSWQRARADAGLMRDVGMLPLEEEEDIAPAERASRQRNLAVYRKHAAAVDPVYLDWKDAEASQRQ